MTDFQARRGAKVRFDHAKTVRGSGDHDVAAVELEGDAAILAASFGLHLDCAERSAFDFNLELLDWRDQDMAAVGLAAKDGREQPHHCRSGDWRTLMVPGAVPSDTHFAVPAMRRVPALHRRKPPIVGKLLQIGKAQSLEFDRKTGLGHRPSLLRRAGDDNRVAMRDQSRTAIVTGAGKRVGAVIAKSLVADGWSVIAHVHHPDDEVPPGAVKVVAELADKFCADAIFGAARALSPVRLLVNNAARFARDGFGNFSADELDAHLAVNLRAPVLLTETFASHHRAGEDGLVVNLLDSKLAAPNPDFLSYTLSKQALAGFTELAARALAPKGIRVNGVAPSLMLRSPGQTEENFDRVHSHNPLGRGVTPEDVAATIRYLAAARTVTGEVIVIDGGQRFSPPERDVQFL